MLRPVLICVGLPLFLARTASAVREHGCLGVFDALNAHATMRLASTDLALSLRLVLVWMRRDARDLALPFGRHAAVTVAFGVAGPLVYLLHREWSGAAAQVSRRA
jgi:hypothetical protein